MIGYIFMKRSRSNDLEMEKALKVPVSEMDSNIESIGNL